MLSDELRRKKSRCPAVFTIVVIAAVAAGLYFLFAERVPGRVVLEADFEKGMIEYLPADPYAGLILSDRLLVRDVVETLERASEDDRVKGLVARMGNARMTPALVQELRDAVTAFRQAGKPAIAYAESFGEAGPGNLSYYLASAFDEVYLQPSGAVGLTGFISGRSFFRGTLDKLGIVPRLDGRKEYKSYRYVFTERRYLPPHKEAVMHVLDIRFGQMTRGIAETRGLSEEEVRALVDNGPFIGQDAVDAKLVDGLAYRDEVYEKMKVKTEEKAEFMKLAEYRRRSGGPHEKGTTVALIYGVGGIQRGKSGYNPATGDFVMGSDTITSAFRKAVEDEDVRAILFRIDSPGGSVVASDAIWRETINAKKAGKPVIVSMGSTAASGGYYVAMAADKIVAQPGTITGSIGVIGGKIVTTGFWNKLGVSWDEVHIGKNADAWTFRKDFTPEQRARFGKWLDRIYEDFTAKVG
ncbi:MAG TPA: S49 family peptidase, partial [Nitrospirota bacterium]